MNWFFAFFALSGFCSLVYEIVWLRLAMAQFGVNTAVVSLFLSLFMAGLGAGSWWAGRGGRRGGLKRYAAAELFIASGSVAVPLIFSWGHGAIGGAWGSWGYLAASGACLAAALLPWSAAMGMTFPLAMSAIKEHFPEESERSFSYLYAANVLGAAAGVLLSAFALIELLGFAATLRAAALVNVLVAALAYRLSGRLSSRPRPPAPAPAPAAGAPKGALGLLFLTGCVSMALEVVWTRQFMPFIGMHVYAFAGLLALYLLSSNFGALAYRRWGRALEPELIGAGWALAGLLGCLSLLFADPFLFGLEGGAARLAVSVVPFSAALGFLTPLLVDRWSRGEPGRAGTAYAVNILGCIAGPLLAGFLLLPLLTERWATALLLAPLFAAGLAACGPRREFCRTALGVAAVLLWVTKDFDGFYGPSQVRRDATATVIAATVNDRKALVVNGTSVTGLVDVTKWMAHVPLAFMARPAKNALVICFGMGTTFRSLRSWGIPVTTVDLIPSVPKLFGYFHADAQELLASPLSRVVIDDGRRFLERTGERYDVINVDPAPPVEAAGTSLLYSREFYAAAKKRLAPGGMLQQWHYHASVDRVVLASITRALLESFPHVRVFWQAPKGFLFLASDVPIPKLTARQLAKRLPPAAVRDLQEWRPQGEPLERLLQEILGLEVALEVFLQALPPTPALRDDRPVNEYYFLRDYVAPMIPRW